MEQPIDLWACYGSRSSSSGVRGRDREREGEREREGDRDRKGERDPTGRGGKEDDAIANRKKL